MSPIKRAETSKRARLRAEYRKTLEVIETSCNGQRGYGRKLLVSFCALISHITLKNIRPPVWQQKLFPSMDTNQLPLQCMYNIVIGEINHSNSEQMDSGIVSKKTFKQFG